MRTWLRFAIVLILLVSLVGCATTGARFSEMRPLLSDVDASLGRIYIYRTAVMGAAVQPAIYVNDMEVGHAIPRGFFYVDRPPGNYQIRTTTEVKRTLSLTLSPGQVRYVKLQISFGFFVGHVYAELVENEIGEAEIQKLRYTGKAKDSF